MVQSNISAEAPGDQILAALITIGRATRKRLDASLDQGSYWVLHTLSRCGPIRGSDLAQACELDTSTVSRQLRQLADNGLVERRPDPDDGRAYLLSLSPEGQQVTATARARKRALLLDRLAGWPAEDVAALARLLGRLADEVSAPPPPGGVPEQQPPAGVPHQNATTERPTR